MHDVAVIVVAAEVVGYDFAKGFREKAFVDVFDGVVNVCLFMITWHLVLNLEKLTKQKSTARFVKLLNSLVLQTIFSVNQRLSLVVSASVLL